MPGKNGEGNPRIVDSVELSGGVGVQTSGSKHESSI